MYLILCPSFFPFLIPNILAALATFLSKSPYQSPTRLCH